MDIKEVLTQYDSMFGTYTLVQIEEYLYAKIAEAVSQKDDGAIITLLNEMIGLCRDTSQKEKALTYCGMLLELLNKMQLQGTDSYATSLQNVANAYRAFGLLDEAEETFRLIEATYEVCLEKGDYLWASLYNNWGLLYQEKKEYEKSVAMLRKALVIIDAIESAKIQKASTRTNLANSLMQLSEDICFDEAYQCLKEAIAVFAEDGERDFHYGAALVAMGDYHIASENYQEAKVYYQKGLVEILLHTGKTDAYYRVLEKYETADKKIRQARKWTKNLEKSRELYERYGVAMIKESFPGYEKRIAVGMVGEGSDCFGFDDEISADHDYAPGFCMWLTRQDYQKIGAELQAAYEKLIKDINSTADTERKTDENRFLMTRRGVFCIDDFYKPYEEEIKLSEQVNGAVFRDDLGIFSKKREELLAYYPEEILRKKLANLLHEFSQYAQCNYARMMARNDYLTAAQCISKAVEAAMDIAYVLNKKYTPYYKWKKKGLEELHTVSELLWICEELMCLPIQKEAWKGVTYSAAQLNVRDKGVLLLELLAKELLQKLKELKLVEGDDPFLEIYIGQILEGEKPMVDKVVDLEWKQFDKVQNEGGRASCQDDFETFSIMRKSQYLTWNEELLQSYYNDLLSAEAKGWNLITEKYARMMQSTAPKQYETLKNSLPVRSDERIAVAEAIIKIQVSWMEEFSKQYPKMANNARSIHTYEDTAYNTSYETYLRGELGTYSEETFILYGRFIEGLVREGKNLAYETMKNTARLYGYESLEAAEAKVKPQNSCSILK